MTVLSNTMVTALYYSLWSNNYGASLYTNCLAKSVFWYFCVLFDLQSVETSSSVPSYRGSAVTVSLLTGEVGWNEHRTRDGTCYYHNPSTGESQWEKPVEFEGRSTELNRDEIQVRLADGVGRGG